MVASNELAFEYKPRMFAQRSSHASSREASLPATIVTPALSDEIAFLAKHGVPLSVLLEADARARRTGASPASLVLASGHVSDLMFYSALARRLDVPFVAIPPAFARAPGAIPAGASIVPLADGRRFLVAPEGEGLAALLALSRKGRAPLDRIAITTPKRLAAWTRVRSARAVALAACDELRSFDPALSAATPLRLNGKLASAAIGAGLVIALWHVGAGWLALCALFGIVAGCSIVLRLISAAATLEAPAIRAPVLPDERLPTYTIIVPLYREAAVIARLAASIDGLDYPKSKIEVKLVVEVDDGETRSAIEALRLPERFDMVVAPAGAPRTKPRALNVALAGARGSLIVVFDAEDAPERDQLRVAAERFAVAGPKVACLQARLAIDNTGDGWLSALFGIEYAALFDVLNPGLAALGAPMMLGGTSNHFRKGALLRLRGWDAWNVTEDADLGLRLARFGYRVETIDSTTHEEAPSALRAWLPQRRRWIKGWMQTLVVHARDPARLIRELGPRNAARALVLLANGVLGPLLAPLFALVMVCDAIWGDLLAPRATLEIVLSTLWISLTIAGLTSVLWLSALGIRRRGLRREARWLFALPAYHLLLSVAAWGALFELWRDPFSWSKTSHGHARTSRRTQ
jgi:cellulose synthase/poly-beta-1,6-N-acetylglucosamine synthase-like glycosyltransferase